MVAVLDRDDQHHGACAQAMKDIRGPLVTVWPAVAEAVYLLGSLPEAQQTLLENIENDSPRIAHLDATDVPRIRELMRKYGDRPMDLADACLVRVAERERIDTVFTVDRVDFEIYRPSGIGRLKILP
jgi:predicted nucleic acid-binding protein